MANRLRGIDRLHAAEREHLPCAVYVFPIERRVPTVSADAVPSVAEPQLGPFVAAVGDERLPLAIRDEPVGDTTRVDVLSMPWLLVVVAEALFIMTESTHAGFEVNKSKLRYAAVAEPVPRRAKGRPERIAPQQ